VDFATGQRKDDVAREYLAGFTGTEVPNASVLPGVANSPGTDEQVAIEIAYPPGPFGPILIGQPGTERLDYLLGGLARTGAADCARSDCGSSIRFWPVPTRSRPYSRRRPAG